MLSAKALGKLQSPKWPHSQDWQLLLAPTGNSAAAIGQDPQFASASSFPCGCLGFSEPDGWAP